MTSTGPGHEAEAVALQAMAAVDADVLGERYVGTLKGWRAASAGSRTDVDPALTASLDDLDAQDRPEIQRLSRLRSLTISALQPGDQYDS
jgi:hypothetical protein